MSHIMTFLSKNSLFLLFMLLIDWLKKTNAAEHYERKKFDLYKDDILTLTYVLIDNFLSLFCKEMKEIIAVNVSMLLSSINNSIDKISIFVNL